MRKESIKMCEEENYESSLDRIKKRKFCRNQTLEELIENKHILKIKRYHEVYLMRKEYNGWKKNKS